MELSNYIVSKLVYNILHPIYGTYHLLPTCFVAWTSQYSYQPQTNNDEACLEDIYYSLDCMMKHDAWKTIRLIIYYIYLVTKYHGHPSRVWPWA